MLDDLKANAWADNVTTPHDGAVTVISVALIKLVEVRVDELVATRRARGLAFAGRPLAWLRAVDRRRRDAPPGLGRPKQSTGDVRRYRRSGQSETVISIPINFFTQGWIQVMTDSEIANWLMWRDQADMRAADVTAVDDLFLEAQDRLEVYHLTRDAWDTHQMLIRLG
jgi:hypothetical protein